MVGPPSSMVAGPRGSSWQARSDCTYLRLGCLSRRKTYLRSSRDNGPHSKPIKTRLSPAGQPRTESWPIHVLTNDDPQSIDLRQFHLREFSSAARGDSRSRGLGERRPHELRTLRLTTALLDKRRRNGVLLFTRRKGSLR